MSDIAEVLGYHEQQAEITRLRAKVDELENPGWEQFISLTTQWLEKYPPNIFDGSSGDKGPLFVVALRNALAALKQEDKT